MKVRILVIDDDDDILFLANRYLNKLDPDILIVPTNNPQDALQELDTGHVDAIICDFHLGSNEMDGLEILQWVRSNGMDTPFIMFTGRSREDIAIKALNLGADYYLEKGNDFEGLFKEIVHHITTIVRNRKIEVALEESEANKDSILRVAPIGIGVVRNRVLQYASGYLLDLLGYSKDELLGKNAVMLYESQEEYERVGTEKYQSIQETGTGAIETRLKKKDGTVIDVDLRSTPVVKGDLEGPITFTILDITERKKNQKYLTFAAQKWRDTFDAIPDFVSVHDLDYRIVKANNEFLDFLGLEAEDVIGKKCYEVVHHTAEPPDNCPLARTRTKKESVTDIVLDPKSGCPLKVTTSPIKNEEGKMVGIVHVARNITDELAKEAAQKESEKKFRMIAENAREVFWIVSQDLTEIYYVSPSYETITGLTCDSLLTNPENWHKNIHEADKDELFESIKQISKETPPTFTLPKYRIIRPDGKIRWIESRGKQVQEYEDTPFRILGVSEDITERVQAESELKTFIEAIYVANSGFILTNLEGRILYANKSMLDMLLITEMKISNGLDIQSIAPKTSEKIIKKVRLHGTCTEEFSAKNQEGEDTHILLVASIVKDDKNKPIAIQASVMDVSHLKHSEQKYRTIVHSMSDLIFVFDAQNRIVEYHASDESELFRPPSEFLCKPIQEVMPLGVGELLEKKFQIVRENVQPERLEYRLTLEGVEKWWEAIITLHEDGESIVADTRDITKRKLDEGTITSQRDFIKKVIEALPHPFYVVDAEDYSVKLANQMATENDDIMNKTCYELTHNRDSPCSGEDHPCPLCKVKETGEPIVVEHVHFDKQGREREIEVHGHPIFDASGTVTQMIEYGIDVTEYKKDLRACERDYRQLYEDAPLAYQSLDINGLIMSVNSAWLKTLGYSREEVIGVHFSKFLAYESAILFGDLFSKFKQAGKVTNIEHIMLRKDGSQIITRFDGTIKLDQNGDFKQSHCIFQDVTEQKKTDTLLRKQKEELSGLVHMMTHDLGNKMLNIQGLVDLLRRDNDPDILLRIYSIAEQTKSLLQSSADLADAGQVLEEPKPVDLNGIVSEMASTNIPDEISFVKDHLPLVLGSPDRIGQIIENLIINAVEHGSPQTIEVRHITTERGIKLLISNDGKRIPEHLQSKIFQRGVTTKEGSTGYGLSVVKKLVEAHGWWISLDSSSRTTFEIFIPASSVVK
ncbi:MAG: PAS domain S-box protein [Candidatus Thorarchaeota archaeon]